MQDEFSVFFDHLRPSANRMGDFEEINWTEEKEYEVEESFCKTRKDKSREIIEMFQLEGLKLWLHLQSD